MTPVEQAEAALELARAEQALAEAKKGRDPEALRVAKLEVRDVRQRTRAMVAHQVGADGGRNATAKARAIKGTVKHGKG